MRASDKAYRHLLAEIVDGTLAPGAMLAEVEQSTRLGVSRTPLREALSRLNADGLVMSQPGRGVVVTDVSFADITELYEVREGLEEQAARLAAQRRDPAVFENLARQFIAAPGLIESGEQGIRLYYELNEKFDAAVDEAVNNAYLVTALRNVRMHLSRIRRMARHNPERLRDSAKETLLVLEAIIDGDAALAAHATHVHLHNSLTNIKAAVSGQITASKVA
ncbi:MAG: putative HTH-type transcriptional regulator YdfH [Actinomycetota bacterium]